MRILPVIYNYFIPQTNKTTEKRLHSYPIGAGAIGADRVEISFKCNDTSYIKDAMNTSRIHCPICGCGMLSESDYQKLIKKAEKVKSTEEFINLLQEYKDYVPKNMLDILKRLQKNDIEFHDFINQKAKFAYFKHRRTLENSNLYLRELAQTLPEDKKTELLKAIETTSAKDNQFYYRKKILPALINANLPQEEYFTTIKRTILRLRRNDQYYGIFKIPERENMSVQELSKELVERIFTHSVVDISKISKLSSFENPNNEILLCRRCKNKSSKKTFLASTSLDKPNLKYNIANYLSDIGVYLGQKNLETNYQYTFNLCNFMRLISNGNINYDDNEIKKFLKLQNLASRHEEFTPIIQTEIDIPCADCGSTMLPHETRNKILKELDKASKLEDYVNILKKYDKYIGYYAKPISKKFLQLAERNPNITTDELVTKLQSHIDNITTSKIKNELDKFRKIRNYVYKHGNLQDYEKMDKFYKYMYRYLNSGGPIDFTYGKTVEGVFAEVNLKDECPPQIYNFLTSFMKLCYSNGLCKISKEDERIDNNPLKTIVFKIFASNIGTSDHFVAAIKGGGKTKDNLIGLCKTCNIIKGQKTVNAWFKNNPTNIKQNFLKQLQVIDVMSKYGLIEDYDDWAKNRAEDMFKLTLGKCDLREYFDNDTLM